MFSTSTLNNNNSSSSADSENIQEEYETITHSQQIPPNPSPFKRPSPPLPKRQSAILPQRSNSDADNDNDYLDPDEHPGTHHFKTLLLDPWPIGLGVELRIE